MVVTGLLAGIAGLIGITFGRDEIRNARDSMQQILTDLESLPTGAEEAVSELFNQREDTRRTLTKLEAAAAVVRREAC